MKSIFKFSEAFNIALHSMVFIAAAAPGKMQIGDLAETMSVSKHHLAKVLQRLCKNGLISSIQGPSGGFFVPAGYKNTTILDIYEAIEGKFTIGKCMFDKKICRKTKCPIGRLLESSGKTFQNYFSKTKLSDLI